MWKSDEGMSTDASHEEVSLTQPTFRREKRLPRMFTKKILLIKKVKTAKTAQGTTAKTTHRKGKLKTEPAMKKQTQIKMKQMIFITNRNPATIG